jgi:hypothetical protein
MCVLKQNESICAKATRKIAVEIEAQKTRMKYIRENVLTQSKLVLIFILAFSQLFFHRDILLHRIFLSLSLYSKRFNVQMKILSLSHIRKSSGEKKFLDFSISLHSGNIFLLSSS